MQGFARHLREFFLQPSNDLISRDLALRKRSKHHEHISPCVTRRALDGRIVIKDGDDLRELLPHELKRNGLIGFNPTCEPPRILQWEEALRHLIKEVDIEA